jgi:hypothetical protein
MTMKILFQGCIYESVENSNERELIDGVKNGTLLVHTRKHDNTDFSYGIEPSAGELLRSTESYQNAEEMHGEGPELIFFSDDFSWVLAHPGADYDSIFVEKNNTIQKSLGNGKVQLADGKIVRYEQSPMADYESPLYKDEPAGVEQGDWYTNKGQDVIGVINNAKLVSMLKSTINEATEGKYEVKMISGKKLKTNVAPEKRSLKNLPKYADGKAKVKFQDWLEMKTTTGSVGKGSDGKWYGWSHRAVWGFGIGDKVKKGDIIFDGKEYVIKAEDQAHEAAKKFADGVA